VHVHGRDLDREQLPVGPHGGHDVLLGDEVIAFNIDSGADGPAVPAPTRADLDDWVSANRQSYPVGLVTDSTLTALSIGALPDEPINFVIRTSDMRIVGIMDGVASNLGTQARALCNAPHPGVETLVNGLAPSALRIDDAYAYVRDDVFGVSRVPLSGGTPQVVAAAALSPTAFALDDSNVYFGAGSSGAYTLDQVAKSGGAPLVLESASSSFDSIAVDSSFVYAARGDGVVERIPIGGGTASTLLSGESHPTSMVLDDQNVYFVSQDTHELVVVPKSGGQRISGVPPGGESWPGGTFLPANLVMGQGEIFASGPMFVSGSGFYVPAAAQGAITELQLGQPLNPFLGGPSPSIAMTPQGLVMGFSCTGIGACVDYPRGAIGYKPATGAWTTASPGEPFTNAVAGDAAYVYWTTAETSPGKHDGALRRLSR
jgi:hypothetical protein